jgi:transcriptional regulator with GAF, ATPase, and Fis domain
VAASNRDLRASVANRTFREDLFFRLSVFPIVIPPLRERVTDVPLLARHFVEKFAREQNKRPPHLSSAAVEALERHAWPGNVRELQNCIERAVILADGDTVYAQHLNLGAGELPREAAPARDPWDDIDLSGTLPEASRRVLFEVERRKIQQALDAAQWDHSKAADALQIPPRVVLGRIRDFKLTPPSR